MGVNSEADLYPRDIGENKMIFETQGQKTEGHVEIGTDVGYTSMPGVSGSWESGKESYPLPSR